MHYTKIVFFLGIFFPIIYADNLSFDRKNGMSDTSKKEVIYYDYIGEAITKTTQFGYILACGAFAYYIIGFVALLCRAYSKYYHRNQENVVPQADFISELEEAAKRAVYAAMLVITARNIAGVSSKYEELGIILHHYLNNSEAILGTILNCYYITRPILVKQMTILVFLWLSYKILRYLIHM